MLDSLIGKVLLNAVSKWPPKSTMVHKCSGFILIMMGTRCENFSALEDVSHPVLSHWVPNNFTNMVDGLQLMFHIVNLYPL